MYDFGILLRLILLEICGYHKKGNDVEISARCFVEISGWHRWFQDSILVADLEDHIAVYTSLYRQWKSFALALLSQTGTSSSWQSVKIVPN